ncbi:MAG: hypothetical protein DRR42_24565 [Gammaproteobacteria bacterium]|nr:MAG: hypothetical protein DRR42_24565 [Gammaproteobacteria bacterium]
MKYEIAVLAALVQIDKPTRPKITEQTDISAQKINSSIKNLKAILDIGICWHGAKKTGHYQIESWGSFESGRKIRRKVAALQLSAYKRNREIRYDSDLIKKFYAEDMKLHNYRHSLKLEGLNAKDSSNHLMHLTPTERNKLRDELKKKFTRQKAS